MISYPCPQCRDMLRVDDARAGEAFVCGLCGATSLVPGGALAQATPPTAEPEAAVAATKVWDGTLTTGQATASIAVAVVLIIAMTAGFNRLGDAYRSAQSRRQAQAASAQVAARYATASDLVAEGRYTAALPLLQQEVASNPNAVDALVGLAACEAQLGHFADAEAHAKRALELLPEKVYGDLADQRRNTSLRGTAWNTLARVYNATGRSGLATAASMQNFATGVEAFDQGMRSGLEAR